MHHVPGQASVEYVAVVALVTAVLLASVALTSGGLGERVVWAWQSALCRVTGGRCPGPPGDRADLPPCPLSDETKEQGGSVAVAVLKLGRRLGLRTERYSDGHVEVSFADDGSKGLIVGLGGHVKVGPVAAGDDVSAGVDWAVAGGRTWRFADAAAARRFVDRFGGRQTVGGQALHVLRTACFVCGWLGHGERSLPPASSTTHANGTAVKLEAGGGSAWAVGVSADLNDQLLGYRVDRGGGGAVFLRTGNAARAAAPLLAGAGALVSREDAIELDFDARGRATKYVVHALRGLGAGAAGASGLVGESATGGRLRETQTTLLDPSPADVRAARVLVGHRVPTGAEAHDLQALGVDLRRRAVTETRVYGLRAHHTDARADLDAGLVAELGVETDHATLRLLGETTKVPGLPELPRDDCHARPGT